MTGRIGGLPFWELRFDAAGDPDPAALSELLAGIRANRVTDLIIFAHGWNNDRRIANGFFEGFFGLLAGQHARAAAAPGRLGLAGVHWPARRWPDEPVPDFPPAGPIADLATVGGAAAHRLTAAAVVLAEPTPTAGAVPLDTGILDGLRRTFPSGATALDRMAGLLATTPNRARVDEFAYLMREFAASVAAGFDDGEGTGLVPGMLRDEPEVLFTRYLDELRRCGAPLPGADGGAGAVGLLDPMRGIWSGAREALRQLTYWQMKNRAGVVGRSGLGPVLGRLRPAVPGIRVHLVGHSFGARLVCFALAGLADDACMGGLVRSVTLFQGAFSQFAFADPLPFAAARCGALAGVPARVDGPLTVCYSVHDCALGVFYPLASMAAGDDAAALRGVWQRWGAIGAHGARGVTAHRDLVQPAGSSAKYRFAPRRVLNVDASAVVCRGGPPAGAHSDILRPELTWTVLAGGGLV